ncbi:MAG: TlpA family protein disulfide reductase [Acidobacteria bacterium]|nr:TlpA family protein disulfide reductase [Acidobacteriota bacterium]
MKNRALLPIGLMLMAIAGVWIAVQGGSPSEAESAAADAALAEMPAGDPVTLQFFRNPQPVAAFDLATIDGGTLSSADWRGTVTLVNFWATWCGPCRAEIPDLIRLQKKYAKHLRVIGISEDETPDVVKTFIDEQGMNYPVAMATDQTRAAFPGIAALPTSYLIDREGRIVQKHVGLLNAERTEREARALAGLPVNAVIEQVDPVQRIVLDEGPGAVTEIPGVDLSSIPAESRGEALNKLNAENCTCGCQLSVAKCRVDDPTCGVSLPLARSIVKSFGVKE